MTTKGKYESSGETPEITLSLSQKSRKNLGLNRRETSRNDLDVVVSGSMLLMSLPMMTLAAASKLVSGMRERNELIQCDGKYKLMWKHDMSQDVDKESLVKVLKLCRGDTIRVGVKNGECCAVIAALFRLDLWCATEVATKLCDFAEEQARRNVVFGATLLKTSSRYPECCDQRWCTLNTRLAKIVLSKDMICHEYGTVVDGCLMALEPRYLDMAEYGEPNTRWGEFSVRTRYIRYHTGLQTQEKMDILKHHLGSLTKEKLEVLEQLGVLKPDILFSLYVSLQDKTEKNTSKNGKEELGVRKPDSGMSLAESPQASTEKSTSKSDQVNRFQQQSKSCD